MRGIVSSALIGVVLLAGATPACAQFRWRDDGMPERAAPAPSRDRWVGQQGAWGGWDRAGAQRFDPPPQPSPPPYYSSLQQRPVLGGGIRDGGAQPEIVPVAPPIVAFRHPYPAGSIVIDSEGRRLYFVLPDAKAYAYQISVGREGFDWVGSEIVSRKQAWPDWHPPAEMRARDPSLPEKMTGGVNNPLGAMALYLGTTLYRIHGTNDERTLGQAASSGCFRMINGAVVHLASLTEVGTTVHVVRSLGPSAPLAGPARTAPSGVAVTAPAPRPVPPPRVRRDPWSDWDRTDTWPRRDWSGNPWR